MLEWEASIGFFLQNKGHQVEAVICDGLSTACILREKVNDDPKKWAKTCKECKCRIKKVFDSFNIKNSFYSQNLGTFEKIKLKIKAFFKEPSETVLRHAIASTIRYAKSVNISKESNVLKKYCHSGVYNNYLAKKIFVKNQPDYVLMSHGIYSDWGPAKDVALHLKIPIFTYAGAYLKNCFYFGILRNQKDSVWGWRFNSIKGNKGISTRIGKNLKKYILERYENGKGFDLKTNFQIQKDSTKKKQNLISVFLHLTWDASGEIFGFDFENLMQWAEFTYVYAQKNTRVNWVFKVHPAEKWHGTSDPLKEKLEQIGINPKIKIIGPDSKMSPLTLIKESKCIVTAFGTVGLEAAVLGKPVICSRGAHYSGFGFTYDWEKIDDYKKLLNNIHNLPPLNNQQIMHARTYAFEIWCKKQRKLDFLDNKEPKNYGELKQDKQIKKLIEKDRTLAHLEKILERSDKKQAMAI